MMKNTRTGCRNAADRGFTLLEMLVVIGIIGVLISMIVPAVHAIRKIAHNARALQEAKSLVTQVTAYRTDYGKYPLQVDANQDRLFETPQYEQLIAILRVDPSYPDLDRWNPRRRVYLEIPEQTLINRRWKDPWGNDYRVAMDFTGDRQISSTVMNGHGTLTNVPVAVWSFGMDGLSGPNPAHRRDDVVSW